MKEKLNRTFFVNGIWKGRTPKFDKSVEGDLIRENQWLRMENEYLKNECLSSCGRAKAAIVSELKQKYPLKDLLQLSGLAKKHVLLLSKAEKYR